MLRSRFDYEYSSACSKWPSCMVISCYTEPMFNAKGLVLMFLGEAAEAMRMVFFQHLLGNAVQVEPMKPTLQAPGTKRLKLNCDEPLSSFAVDSYLRRYIWEHNSSASSRGCSTPARPTSSSCASASPCSRSAP